MNLNSAWAIFLTLVLFSICLSQGAHSALFDRSGNAIHDARVHSDEVAWTFPAFGQSANLTGVVMVNKPDLRGSGALIKVSSDPSAPAYILTAGHVAAARRFYPSLLENDIVDGTPDKGDQVVFNVFWKVPSGWIFEASVKRVVFAVMNGTDIGLLELDRTVKDLESWGVTPFRLSESLPTVSEKVRVVGNPLDIGYITLSEGIIGSPRLSKAASGHEWPNSYEISASIIEGMSGSPVLNKDNEIIGVVNAAGNRANSFQSIAHLKSQFDSTGRYRSQGPKSRRPVLDVLTCANLLVK